MIIDPFYLIRLRNQNFIRDLAVKRMIVAFNNGEVLNYTDETAKIREEDICVNLDRESSPDAS